MTTNFIFRFDAGPQSGAGHFMRQLAVAQRASQQGRAVMLLPSSADALADHIASDIESSVLPDMSPDEEIAWMAQRFAGSVFFVDSYLLPVGYYGALAKHGFVVAFEDGDRLLGAQLTVKPRPLDAREELAPNVLEGCDYVPVRREFSSPLLRSDTSARLMVCFGASDPTGRTASLLASLPDSAAATWKVSIVRGPLCQASEESLGAAALRTRGFDVEVCHNPKMAALLGAVDGAIVAAGSIVWELAAMAVPTLAIPVAENQERNARELGRRESVATENDLGRFLSDTSWRAELAANLHALIDGQGAERIVAAAIERSA